VASGIDKNNCTPAIVANGVLSWKATPHLTLHTHLLFESRQKSYFINLKNYYQAYNMAVKALEALDGVESATASYTEGTAVVELSKEVPAESFKKSIEDKDYKFISVE
jgi:copper chaperone CopZ